MRILIVEDEKEIADGIQAILQHEGYESDVVYAGDEGLEYIRTGIYDLVLLDVMLPGKEGFEVLAAAQKEGIDTPVILLTARSMVEDKIKGLNLGAEDYMTKPFDAGELLARIHARLRSRSGNAVGNSLNVISAFDIALDRATYKLSRDDKSIKLSGKEYQFMEYLMLNKGKILTREAIANRVWGFDDEAEYNNIAVYASFLRKKLKFISAKAAIITKKDVGYSLEENDGKSTS